MMPSTWNFVLHVVLLINYIEMELFPITKQFDLNIRNFTVRIPQMQTKNGYFKFDKIFIEADLVESIDSSPPTDSENVIVYEALSTSINSSISPCDDFYHFVCDGWAQNHKIPAYDNMYDRFANIQTNINKKLKEILESGITSEDSKLRKMGIFFEKCLNIDEKERIKTGFLFSQLNKFKPLTLENFTEFLISYYPNGAFFVSQPLPDIKNSSVNRLYIQTPNTGINYNYLLLPEFNKTKQAFRRYLTQVLELCVEDDINHIIYVNGTNEINRRVNNYMYYQEQLAKISNASYYDSKPDDQGQSYELIHISKLQALVPSLNWTKYYKSVFGEDIQDQINFDELLVYIVDKKSVVDLDRMLQSFTPQQYSDVVEWLILFDSYATLDSRFKLIDTEFNVIYSGVKKQRTNEIICVEQTSEIFSDLVEVQYITLYFDQTKREKVSDIVKTIIVAYEKMLQENDWMDPNTKIGALEKLKNMIIHVGYSDNIFNKTKLDMDYLPLSLSESDSWPVILQKTGLWKTDRLLRKMVAPRNYVNKNMPSFISNAYYMASENTIGILAGSMNDGFYESDHSAALNYGGLGSIIGHEITHSFDDSGSQYDYKGNINNWWDHSTKALFLQKKACFVELYGKTMIEELGEYLDGYRTISENIADASGLKVSFLAMHEASKLETKSRKVKGLEQYNSEQLFFINFAFNFCSVETIDSLKYQLREESHTIPRYRINVLLANSLEFRNAFQCKNGDRMVNEKMCRIF